MKYFKSILVLTIIALLSGLFIGLAHSLISNESLMPGIEALNALCPDAADYKPVPDITSYDATGSVKGVYIPLGSDGKALSDSFIFWTSGNGGYGGEVSMLILVTDERIIDIAVYEHKETPGKGTPAFEDSYISQFLGSDIYEFFAFPIGKGSWLKDVPAGVSDGNKIDAITGATRSSRAVLNNINAAVRCYAVNKNILQITLNSVKD